MSTRKPAINLGLLVTAVTLAIAPAGAQQGGNDSRASRDAATQQGEETVSAAPLARPNPYLRADETWITIRGTVRDVGPDAFDLAYGEDGEITVEMDDDDRDADGYTLRNGDEVTVHGKIDDDFFERTTIEASAVYLDKLGTYFFASSADEEDVSMVSASAGEVDPTAAQVVGTVTGVSADEFELDRGVRTITVEVENMSYDPLDDEGYQRVGLGDVVSVTGNIDHDFFEGRELDARSIVTLFDHPG